MSKGSIYWGNASGKLGESVFYRSGGEQRNRTYVRNVKNPKSVKQMTQRFKMLNLMAAFHGLSSVLQISFPDKASKRNAWNEFASVNAGRSVACAEPTFIANGICVPNNLIVANGTIGVSTKLASFKIGPNGSEVSASGFELADIYLPVDLTPYGGTDLSTAQPDTLIEGAQVQNNMQAIANYLGLPSAFKLTNIIAYYNDEGFKMIVQRAASVNTLGVPVAGGQAMTIPGYSGGIYKQWALRKADSNTLKLVPLYQLTADLGFESIMLGVILSYTDGATSKLKVTRSMVYYLPQSSDDDLAKQWYAPNGEIYKQLMQDYATQENNTLGTSTQVAAPSGPSDSDGGEGGGATIPDPIGPGSGSDSTGQEGSGPSIPDHMG